MLNLVQRDETKTGGQWFKAAYGGSRYRWYPVLAKGGQEFRSCEELRNQGFVAYAPYYMAERKPHRRVVELKRPLYGCYVFVGVLDGAQSIRPILSTRGVRDVVRCGETILSLSVDSMAIVAERFAPDGDSGLIEARYSTITNKMNDGTVFHPGEKAIINSGPLGGLSCVVEAVCSTGRVKIKVDTSTNQITICAHTSTLLHSLAS